MPATGYTRGAEAKACEKTTVGATARPASPALIGVDGLAAAPPGGPTSEATPPFSSSSSSYSGSPLTSCKDRGGTILARSVIGANISGDTITDAGRREVHQGSGIRAVPPQEGLPCRCSCRRRRCTTVGAAIIPAATAAAATTSVEGIVTPHTSSSSSSSSSSAAAAQTVPPPEAATALVHPELPAAAASVAGTVPSSAGKDVAAAHALMVSGNTCSGDYIQSCEEGVNMCGICLPSSPVPGMSSTSPSMSM